MAELSAEASADFLAMWAELSELGGTPEAGYRRFAWTVEDAALRAWFVRHCREVGLSVTEDRAGNQWGWWIPATVTEPQPGVAVGSHLDSVPDGGAFDGPLGVVSALAAVGELRRRGFVPAVPIGVVNFADEEGARFGVACLGSRVLTGVIAPERALAFADDAGISLAAALAAAGRNPADYGPDPDALAKLGCFVELHVEQGRFLVDVDQPLAVATEIWPHGRWRIEIPGQADHAGTTRLEDRADAMVGAAAVVLEARWAAAQQNAVATVGKLRVTPGGVNAIPSQVTAWLDARAPREADVIGVVERVRDRAGELGGTISQESWTPPTPFDAGLRQRLVDLLGVPEVGTGAGHDAGILANAGVPTAMLFVRNPTGTSHSPREFATEADCLLGVAALTAVVADLAGEGR